MNNRERTPKQSERSEIKRASNPFKEGPAKLDRFSYYTRISLEVFGMKLKLPFKFDTGSAYTIIGTGNSNLKPILNNILKLPVTEKAYDASETPIRLRCCECRNFRLTDDVVFDKIHIYFSEDIGDKVLLGLDIISLFDHLYKHKDRSYWLYNYTESLNDLPKDRPVSPDRIMSIDQDKPNAGLMDYYSNYLNDRLTELNNKEE